MSKTCPHCHKVFARQLNLNYHLTKGVCTGKTAYSELADMSEERLRLIISLKEKEIELAKLSLNLEKTPLISNRKKVLVKLKRKAKIELLNFGQENCEVFGQLLPRDDIEFIGKELIEALHFNPKYPENHNLCYPDKEDDHLLVYVDNDWKSVYHLTLISEYLRGNLFRLKRITPLHSKIKKTVEDHIDQIQQLCRQTLSLRDINRGKDT